MVFILETLGDHVVIEEESSTNLHLRALLVDRGLVSILVHTRQPAREGHVLEWHRIELLTEVLDIIDQRVLTIIQKDGDACLNGRSAHLRSRRANGLDAYHLHLRSSEADTLLVEHLHHVVLLASP